MRLWTYWANAQRGRKVIGKILDIVSLSKNGVVGGGYHDVARWGYYFQWVAATDTHTTNACICSRHVCWAVLLGTALFVPPPNSVLYLSFSPLQRDLPRTEPPRVHIDSSPFTSVRVSLFCPEVGPLTCPCRSLQQVVAAPLFTLFRIVLAGRQWQCGGLARGSKLKLKVDHKHMIVIVLSSTIGP